MRNVGIRTKNTVIYILYQASEREGKVEIESAILRKQQSDA